MSAANRPGAKNTPDVESRAEVTSLLLVVTRGTAVGARFVVGAAPEVVGRAPDAGVRLEDPRVSRKHAQVWLADGGIRFRCFSGAAPLLIGERETSDGIARLGQHVIVGETVLVVAAAESTEDATDIKTLMSGAATDVRGLSAIVALTETLDTAKSRADVAPLLGAWAAQYVRANGVKLVEDRGASDQIVSRHHEASAASVVAVPAHAELGARLEFEVAAGAAGVPIAVLRLLAVAGRVCGSTLARLDAIESIEKEKAALRQLAVGSARAFLGESDAAANVTRLIARLAASDAVALLEGETGVGKTFVARLIHEASERAQAPLRVVNCAAIAETLIESEIFGHERGAFTGAVSARAGVFEAAGRGTVLLDEVGELSLASQAKLLHVLEDKSFTRVGSTRSIPLEARILAATNRDLDAMVEEGSLRKDLFFRLSIVRMKIPPLRERGEDLRLLATHILTDLAASSPRRVDGFTDAALDVIRSYPWPGNVRELRNVIEHALVLGDTRRIEVEDLPPGVRAGAAATSSRWRAHASTATAPADARRVVELPADLEWLEKQAIEAALHATSGNQKQAAAILGINRVTLYKKLKAERA